jgi:type II secretory pathway pseudopilin PulG
MKLHLHSRHPIPGFSLLEMTIVIMVLISLISTGLFVSKQMDDNRAGREASETLRVVYSAQRMYLSDYPMEAVSSLTATKIIPYLPNNAAALPTVKSLTGANLSIVVNQLPPFINAGSGVRYDPSGDFRDSLWDVGE